MRTVLLATFAILALLLPHAAFAHTYLSWVQLDGVNHDEGDCVRPHPVSAKENPIPLVTDGNMTCGWLPEAAQPANRACPIKAGGTVGVQWHHLSNTADDDIIATTHKGPCMVYLAKSSTGAGPVWFKIWESGYNAATQTWCVDTLLANKGMITFKLPTDISAGNYLMRAEILALHGANALNGVQPYVGCVELSITGGGSANPAGVAIPGAYANTDKGMFFDLYQAFTSYPIPGPAVYTSGSAPSTPTTPTPTPTDAPAPAPTSTDAPAPAPTTPTQAPSDTNTIVAPTTVRVQLYPSSTQYWLAITTRSTPQTAKIELKDNGAYTTWQTLGTTNWGYWTFPASTPVVLPISVRITDTTGKELELTNIFTSWDQTSFIDTGKKCGGDDAAPVPDPMASAEPESDSAVESAEPEESESESESDGPACVEPNDSDFSASESDSFSSEESEAEPAPTPEESESESEVEPTPEESESEAEPEPTPEESESEADSEVDTSESTGGVSQDTIQVKLHEGSSEWWFAAAFSGNDGEIESVYIKDSLTITSYRPLKLQTWGYWQFETSGDAIVAPVTFKLTDKNGDQVTFSISSLSPNAEFDTETQFGMSE